MADLFQLQGTVTADTRQAEQGLQRVGERARDARGRFIAAGQGAAKLGSDATSATARINALGNSLRNNADAASRFGRSMTVGVTLPIAAFGAAAVKSATSADSLRRGLIAVAGSSAEAERQLVRLKEIAKLPGLGFREAIQGSINLQAAGFSAASAERSLKAFGNALATVGKGKAELDGVTLALTQIQSKGKVSAEEINQIAERVPQLRKAMVAAFGTADTEILQKGKLTANQFINGVVTELEKLPAVTGGAQNSFENLADTASQSLEKIGTPILRTLIPILDRLAPKIEAAANWFDKLSPEAQNAALGIGAVTLAAGPAINTVANLTIAVGGLKAAFAGVSVAAAGTAAMIGAVAALTITQSGGDQPTVARARENDLKNAQRKAEENRRRQIGPRLEYRSGAGYQSPDFVMAPLSLPASTAKPGSTPVDAEAERLRKQIANAARGAGGSGGGRAKELTEAQQLQKRLNELNKEIEYLSKSTSPEYKLRIKIEGAEAARAELDELIKLRSQFGGGSLDQLRARAEYDQNSKNRPSVAVVVPEFIKADLAAREKAAEKEKQILDSITDSTAALREELASLKDPSETGKVNRDLARRGIDPTDTNAAARVAAAQELDNYRAQEKAQDAYKNAVDKAREASERFAESLKNTIENVFERLLGGDTKGAGQALKSYGRSMGASTLTSALFGGRGGGFGMSPALAMGGGGNYAAAMTPGFAGGAGAGAYLGGSGGGARAAVGGYAQEALSGGGPLGGLLNKGVGVLGGLFGLGGKAAGATKTATAAVGAAKAGAGAASGGLGSGFLAALGFSNPISAAITGGLIAAPFIAKLFSKDHLKDYRNLIRGEYGLEVKDKSLLQGVQKIGENKYGKEFDRRKIETVKLPETREAVYEYAQAQGMRGNSKLFSAGLLQDAYSKMNLQARANGGPVAAGMPYLVGERGPEIIKPRTSGTVIPNHELGRGGGSSQSDELARAVMMLVSKMQIRSADQVVMLAGNDTVTRKVEASFRERSPVSESIRDKVNKR